MYKLKEIADKVYYVGVNDRQKALFENMWPLPYGVSYNSYLIVDEKTVLIDTVDVCYSDIFLKKILASSPRQDGLSSGAFCVLIQPRLQDCQAAHSPSRSRMLIFRNSNRIAQNIQ